MQRWLVLLCVVAAHWIPCVATAQQWSDGSFQVLGYHDVRDDPTSAPDRYTVSTANLLQHFAWLRENGFNVVSIDAILAARAGTKPLPPKAVLLTFDDGYRSAYTRVFPLLKVFKYPAVLALSGGWLEVPPDGRVPYEERDLGREEFLQWDEIREMAASGLVEIASHSYDLHHGIRANPQGDQVPAAIARRYNTTTNSYENDTDYNRRVGEDLIRNSDLLARRLGQRPRVMVWPYGRYNGISMRIAHDAGMPIGITLDEGLNTPDVPLERVRRYLVSYNPDVPELAAALTAHMRTVPLRVMHVDLDYVYDPDPQQQTQNIGLLLDRIRDMGINAVFLQAFADPDGNGAADALYFPSRHLPLRSDLFAHVAWQIQTRAGNVKIYAWMPLLAFELPSGEAGVARVNTSETAGKLAQGYPRLSPFDPRAQAVIREIYEDLARHAVFQGLLFHDDATLTDYEDASASALNYYSTIWHMPPDIGRIRADPKLFADWTRRKTHYLIEFSLDLAHRVAPYQARVLTARNLFARVALEPQAEAWFAQSLPAFLASYDYTAVMAMPYLEGADEPIGWLRRLITEVARQPAGLQRSVFELQSVDWRTHHQIASPLIARQMQELQLAGALNFGYYPDDFHRNHPTLEVIKPLFSLETFPYARREDTR
ncbi:MAG TPA: poly-beta-1,6-N-acetyl-D-glucosamine N-deacetylase PgaB [Burkholderiales bacterium]|nr:poly-beta-1,6-N-acetyl-D-glucosamine N-deacetylase PgaB [Burkholderiales bacterium]